MIRIIPWEYQSEAEMVSRFLEGIPLTDRNLVFAPQHLVLGNLPEIDQSAFRQRKQGYGNWVWNEAYKLWWIRGTLPSWIDMHPHIYDVIGMPDGPALSSLHRAIAQTGEAIPLKTGLVPQLAILPVEDRFVVRPVFPFSHEGLECKSGKLLVTPYFSIPRERFFLRTEIAEFEDLINSNPSESEVQDFLKDKDHFLKALGYTEIRSSVVLRKSDSSLLIPDFLARPIYRSFWDIVEIKAPVRNVLVSDRGSVAFSATVYRGINQLKEYAEYFSDQVQSKWFEAENGIKILRPELILLVGAPNPASLVDFQILRARDPEVKIITYSELLSICKRCLLY